MTQPTVNVSTCWVCGKDPALMEFAQGFVIACQEKSCTEKPKVSRPRAGQAVKTWNAKAGFSAERAKLAIAGTPKADCISARPLPIVKVMKPDHWTIRLIWKARRASTRLLWTLSRPGWRPCSPCKGKFKLVIGVKGFECTECSMPYSVKEAERMQRS